MSYEFTLVRALVLAATVFVPTFIVAAVMLREAGRALLLSLVFTAGAASGFFGALALGAVLLRGRLDETFQQALLVALACAGAIAGGVLTVYLLGRFGKFPPWRRP
jgi:hypothetical protein